MDYNLPTPIKAAIILSIYRIDIPHQPALRSSHVRYRIA
jgi:hypothetical protein